MNLLKSLRMRYLFFGLILFLLVGCSKHYTSEKIGWKITLPGKAWKTFTPKENQNINARTKQEVEEFIGVKIDGSRVQELISFGKGPSSNFISVIETYEYADDSYYEQLLTQQHQSIKENHKTKQISAEYEIGASRIGGMMLDWFTIKSYYPGVRTPYIRRIFSCIVNKYIFSVIIGTDNEKDLETLEDVVNSSKFSIRHLSE